MPPARVYRTEAVVLRQRRLGDADKICVLFTPQHGRLEAVAGLTKGFFWSLIFLAIFLPWQHILVHRTADTDIPMLKTAPGVLYGLEELKLQVTPAISDQQVDILREVTLGGRFLLYPIAALLLLVAAQSRYRPQRIEIPRPVAISRLTEKQPDKPQ